MSKKRIILIISIILIYIILIGLWLGSIYYKPEPRPIKPNAIYFGTIIHIAKLENPVGYLVYAQLAPGYRATNKLEFLWVSENSTVVPEDLMKMIETETPGATFRAVVSQNHNDVVYNLLVDHVVAMEFVSEFPGS